MMPYGILPVVGILVFLDHQGLVHIHTQTREFGQLHKAIGETKIIGVVNVIENALAYIVMDADALLLNHGVVAGGVHVQAGGQSDGAQGAMGSQGDIVALRHGTDLFNFGKAWLRSGWMISTPPICSRSLKS